jgi:pseudaminic acid cytidylyltransferase
MKKLAIIPARSGSKRIKNKNIKCFHDQPMMSYSILSALNSGCFDKVHVSTDSEEYAEIAGKYGCKPDFLREHSLADDKTGVMDVVKFVVDKYIAQGEHYDQVCMLMACAPLVTSGMISDASSAASQMGKNRRLLAVSKYPSPTEWAFEINDNNELTPKYSSASFTTGSQDITSAYYDAGLFCFMNIDSILKHHGNGRFDDFIAYDIPQVIAIDIDDEHDWKHAELIYKLLNSKDNSHE